MLGSKLGTIRGTHPNLYLAIIIFATWGILSGLNFIVNGSAVEFGNWRYAIGGLFLVFGIAKLVGLRSYNSIKISRLGMLGCMILCILLSTFYIGNYVSGSLVSWQGALNFLALGVVQLTAISEPAVNPLNMKREKDDV